MSLILDALRKMEQERRSKRGNSQDLRPEVLRYRLAAQPKEKSRYPLAIAAGLVLLCAGLGVGFMLKSRGAAHVADQVPAAPPAVAVQPPVAAVPAPAAPAAAALPQPVSAPSAAAPAAPAQPVIGAATPVPSPAEPIRKTSRTAAPAAAQEAVAQPRVPRGENATAAAGGQDIVISGIAYQDERRMRRAVLNGSLVGEGAEVAGARVVEIKETKVRLSRGGHVFEIPFSSGMQSR
ncbi:general secretion pathway protein GspB [Geomonas edaphica]|uniref:general secretion pathway protein GspB n=1 Tax=Geomonas edaphica TaxID=2570226 RepID=UPI0010A813C7|nr:general secretion pathway protein GspB [Geomonas edaphica]